MQGLFLTSKETQKNLENTWTISLFPGNVSPYSPNSVTLDCHTTFNNTVERAAVTARSWTCLPEESPLLWNITLLLIHYEHLVHKHGWRYMYMLTFTENFSWIGCYWNYGKHGCSLISLGSTTKYNGNISKSIILIFLCPCLQNSWFQVSDLMNVDQESRDSHLLF